MALETMRKNSRFIKLCFFTFLIFFAAVRLYSADTNSNWVIASQEFSYTQGQESNSLTQEIGKMLPVLILEKISKNLERNVLPDERFERTRYSLQTSRQSLYLQLTSEYKKRDALVLYNYSDKVLKSKINEIEKNIQSIEKQIDENLEELKKAQEESQKSMELIHQDMLDNIDDETEFERLKNFFHHIFVQETSLITQENVKLYQNDYTKLYTPRNTDYQSQAFEKEMKSAGINAFITGLITVYGDYLSLALDLYLYPGCKKIGSLVEAGSLKELDLITTSLAGQMIPMFTNALPVTLEIAITPQDAASSTRFFIDDVLQNATNESINLESGPHTIEFISDGYRSLSTTYNFLGNTKYKVEINFEKIIDGHIQIALKKPLEGQLFANGELAEEIKNQKSQIRINGINILGQFVAVDGKTSFYYIPEDLYFDGSMVKINPKPRDREEYINSRRRMLYTSYSLLILSLIPTFYTYGNLVNQAKLNNGNYTVYDDAYNWQIATNICQGISIGCGVFMGYSLIRYLISANSVLPEKAKVLNLETPVEKDKNEDIIED